MPRGVFARTDRADRRIGGHVQTAEARAKIAAFQTGQVRSAETRKRMSRPFTGGYHATHLWMNKHHPRTGTCEDCGSTDRRTEYASIGHTYTRNRDDWRELCKRCHTVLDKRG